MAHTNSDTSHEAADSAVLVGISTYPVLTSEILALARYLREDDLEVMGDRLGAIR
jgi:hypothetical protein